MRVVGSNFDTELSLDSIVQLAKATLWFCCRTKVVEEVVIVLRIIDKIDILIFDGREMILYNKATLLQNREFVQILIQLPGEVHGSEVINLDEILIWNFRIRRSRLSSQRPQIRTWKQQIWSYLLLFHTKNKQPVTICKFVNRSGRVGDYNDFLVPSLYLTFSDLIIMICARNSLEWSLKSRNRKQSKLTLKEFSRIRIETELAQNHRN